MNEIERMQQHLLLIRRSIGWTADQLGEQIGVTRQTINNLETGRSKLTKAQYIAMRSIFDAEMAQAPEETEMLRLLLETLVDHPEKLKEEERQALIDKSQLLAPAILAGTASRKTVSREFLETAASIVSAALVASLVSPAIVTGGIAGWLTHSLLSTKKTAREKKTKEPK